MNLYNNRIGSLPEDVFDGLSELRTLNLKYNQISTLPDGLFSGLSNLEVLYLGNNPGTTFTFKRSWSSGATTAWWSRSPREGHSTCRSP